MNTVRMAGVSVHVIKQRGPPIRPRRTLPACKCFVYFLWRDRILRFAWVPWFGLCLHSESDAKTLKVVYVTYRQPAGELSMKKREALGLGGVPTPAASATSTMLNKVPTIREYLTATSYEDQSLRQVSALRLTTRGGMWTVTLTDPDTMARLVMTAAECDKCLLSLETILQAPDCPWERDPYAKEPKAPRPKKK